MKISVIIPALDEAKGIGETLRQLTEQHSLHEVIVVDGGSRDETREIARRYHVKVLDAEKGRASQMNAGAAAAEGEVFLFLHSDTLLPVGAMDAIRKAIEKGYSAGRFRMRFDDRRWSLRLFETYTRLHCFSYGDQAFFVTRKLFEDLKGYLENVPFEDVDFYKRIRKRTRPVILSHTVITSARRFTQVGCMRQKFINLFLVGLYHFGVDVSRLQKKFYTNVR